MGTFNAIFLEGLFLKNSVMVSYRRKDMADSIKGKIENAGEAVGDAAKKAGEKIKDGANTAAEKAAAAAKSVGQTVKDAGQKLKDKSGA